MSHLPCQVTCLITLISPFREDNYQVPKIIFTLARCLKITEKVYTLKLEACSQIVLPDRSALIGQKLVEIGRIERFKCDTLSNFQTMFNVVENRPKIQLPQIKNLQ